MSRMLPSICATLTLLAVSTASVSVRADWPSARQNAQRTGAATGMSDLVSPTPFWKLFAGGAMAADGAIAVDLDGDGKVEAVFGDASGVTAKSPASGDTVWTGVGSAAMDGVALAGFSDVDGDGSVELVARSRDRAFLVRPTDGKILWSEPLGEMGTLSQIRVGDISGDGKDDLVMIECQCCAINSGKSAVAYSFAEGGATLSSPVLLWAPPQTYCGGHHAATLVRMRDAKKVDFIFGKADGLALLDGPTGQVVAETGVLGTAIQTSDCVPVNVDGDPQEELLCVLSSSSATPTTGHRAYLVDYVSMPTPRLELVWEQDIGTVDGGVSIPPSLVGDLDGDGKLELVLGGKTGSLASTYVIDAATGAVRDAVDGQAPVGIASLGVGGSAELLTSSNGTVHSFELATGPSGKLSERWSLTDHEARWSVDYAAGQVRTIRNELVLLDIDGDGVKELVTTRVSDGRLDLIRSKAGAPDTVGSYAPPSSSKIVGLWPTGSNSSLAIAQSDGNLHVLDETLAPVSGNPGYGARFGNYFASSQFRSLWNSPVLGDLGDAVPGVLVTDSRGALLRLDARSATFSEPPTVMWSSDRTRGAQIVQNLDGTKPGIVAFRALDGENHRILALNADGTLLWEREVVGVVLADMVAGNLDGDAHPDVVVEHGDLSDSLHRVTALSGASGAVLWEATPVGPGNRQPPGGALSDWNDDGRDDFFFVAGGSLRILNGTDGSPMATLDIKSGYHTPILFDVDGDDTLEVSLYAGYTAPGTVAKDLSKLLWQGSDKDRPLTYGAMTTCGGAGTLIGGSWTTPSRLSRFVAGGPAAGTTSHLYLAGGKVFANLASAVGSGAKMGQLGSPSLHDNLGGDGATIAVVGSTDGWVYGVEACSGWLRFAFEIGAPVGAIALGDSNGDGKDELLASAADGHLYALREPLLPAPVNVIDTDPMAGVTEEDVDSIVSQTALHVRWTKVPMAEGYEVAVVKDPADGGGFLTSEPWRAVGNVEEASLTDLALEDGRRYFLAVRAVAGDVRSADTLSDGVRVYFDAKPSGSGGAGGAAGAGGAGGAGGINGAGGMSSGSGEASAASGATGGGDGGAVTGSGGDSDGAHPCVTGGCGSCSLQGRTEDPSTFGWLVIGIAATRLRRSARRKPHA